MNEVKARALERGCEKGLAPEGEIIHPNDYMPGVQEPIGEMTAHKASCPGDEHSLCHSTAF
jgi:hypothetical protein